MKIWPERSLDSSPQRLDASEHTKSPGSRIDGSPANIKVSSPITRSLGDVTPTTRREQSQASSVDYENITDKQAAEITDKKVVDEQSIFWPDVHKCDTADVACAGSIILFCSIEYGWNGALTYGFGAYAMGLFTISAAYIPLFNCVAEMSSTMSFNGGSYGLARVFLGFYPGFMVGALQWVEMIIYCADPIFLMSSLLCQYNDVPQRYEVPLWFLFFGSFAALVALKRRLFFDLTRLFVVGMAIVLIIYICIGAKYGSFHQNAPYLEQDDDYVLPNTISALNATAAESVPFSTRTNWFRAGFHGFMYSLPFATWPYAGQECLMFLVPLAKNPKKDVPEGIVMGGYVLFFTAVIITMVSCSIPPGTYKLSGMLLPMNPGFQNLFGISDKIASAHIIPFLYIGGFWFFLPATLLTSSMAQSNLLPSMFKHEKYGFTNCLLFNVCAALFFCVMQYFGSRIYIMNGNPFFLQNLMSNTALLGGVVACLADLVSFIRLRLRFQEFKRNFRSPYGLPGAFISGVCFLFCFVGTAFFAQDSFTGILAFAMIVTLLTVYYFTIGHENQTLSKEEMTCMFKLHVAMNNKRKSKDLYRKRKSGKERSSLSFKDLKSSMKSLLLNKPSSVPPNDVASHASRDSRHSHHSHAEASFMAQKAASISSGA